jgi:hypothetical protein
MTSRKSLRTSMISSVGQGSRKGCKTSMRDCKETVKAAGQAGEESTKDDLENAGKNEF